MVVFSDSAELVMEQSVMCIVVGGPQHGLAWLRDTINPVPLALITDDGERCTPAARRCSGNRILLLHPQATGEQFLTMLAA
jgi:hypothetical protein